MIEIEEVFETQVTGADILLETLMDEGITTVFGIPGGAISPVYDLFLDTGMTHYLMGHEQAAAHAADGFFRACGNIAVAMATSGPGSLNLTTGLATAYKDRSALLAITGQTSLSRIGTDSFQEVETTSVFDPIVKSSALVTTPKLVEYMVKKMIRISTSSPPGPVHLDFPRDVQTGQTAWLPGFDENTFPSSPRIPYNDICATATLLMDSQLPVVIVGGGVVRSQVSEKVYDLCHLLNCPVVTTLMGKSGFPECDPLFCGMIGSNGSQHANHIVQRADVVLALGTRLSDRTVWSVSEFAPRAHIVCVNVEDRVGTALENTMLVKGDLRTVLPILLALLSERPHTPQWEESESESEVMTPEGPLLSPVAVLKTLRKVFPPDSIFITDTGQHQLFAANYLRISRPSRFITSGGLGCMGFGLPAALGAKVACPASPVVNIGGDGSFLMMCQELVTFVRNQLAVTVCIFNNGYLGMIRQSQLSCFNRISEIDLSPLPDFARLAESFGAEGVRIETLEELLELEPEPERTTVVDIPIDPDVPVPSHSYSWTGR
ncbi:MAG: thiamine pyrophosphate-binding protein [Theionarchaea archaeon]|nr:thiamine pyrophosphate-binding protein [Theionarchaea archaeon]MBU7021071.1 thiamine pyrophosphate-binding protein [Theionarchaea archaeon]